MIRSFASRDTERLFLREHVRKFPSSLLRIMYWKLLILESAESLQDLRIPPGNRLEKLRGRRAGQFSIRVND